MTDAEQSDWIDWSEAGLPVPPETEVQIRMRDGEELSGTADAFTWRGQVGAICDIVAYRVVGGPPIRRH